MNSSPDFSRMADTVVPDGPLDAPGAGFVRGTLIGACFWAVLVGAWLWN